MKWGGFGAPIFLPVSSRIYFNDIAVGIYAFSGDWPIYPNFTTITPKFRLKGAVTSG